MQGVEHPVTEVIILVVAERNGTKGWGKEEGRVGIKPGLSSVKLTSDGSIGRP